MSNRVNTSLAYVPFSEERVVDKLIRNRATLDASYYATTEPQHVLATEGVFALNEDVLCIYADLDSLIDRAGLSEQELLTVKLLMKGYALADIADHYGKSRQNFDILLKRAVKKIVKQNNADWEETTGGRLDDGEW